MNKKKKRLRRLWIILLVLALLLGGELLYSNYAITVSRYSVSSEKLSAPLRIVFFSDLHGREFGQGNQRLLKKIEAQSPDVICMVGDIFNSDADEVEICAMCDTIQAVSRIAPLYFCLGNHEAAYVRSNGTALLERVREAGAVVLDASYLDLELKGNAIRIGGYMGFYQTPHMDSHDPEEQRQHAAFASDFERTDRFKLLLNHIPTNWLDWEYRNKYPVDLVLSGHYHGGIVRIPFLEQGLYAPYVGKFPPYTKGMFQGEKACCILTTGFVGYKIPRFFNPPEIVVVELSPG